MNNHIIYLCISIFLYFVIVVFLSKIFTQKLRKIANEYNDYQNYNIILGGILFSGGILGKEIFENFNSTIIVLERNNSISEIFQQLGIHIVISVILLIIAYSCAFALMKFFFDKENIIKLITSTKITYSLLFAIIMITISNSFAIVAGEILLEFAPIIQGSLYN